MTNPAPTPPPRRRFELSLRDLVILLVSAISGTGTGLLLTTEALPPGQAVLSGFAAFVATLYFLDRITL